MKKVFLLALLVILGASHARAYDFSAVSPSGQTLYYIIDHDEAVVVCPNAPNDYSWNGYDIPTGSLAIPATVDYNGFSLEVKRIDRNAFADCVNLTAVYLPYTLTQIGDNAFAGCAHLVHVSFPLNLEYIGSAAFYNCASLDSIMVAHTVTSLGNSAFEGCSGAVYLFLGSGLTNIGNYAFRYCEQLTRVVIPDSVVGIGEEAFSHCSRMEQLTIGAGATYIGSHAFSYCGQLATVYLNAVEGVAFGSEVNTLFWYCGHITQVVVGEQVRNIPDYTFLYSSSHFDLTLGGALERIGREAFNGCVKSINTHAVTPPLLEPEAFRYIPDSIPVTVPCGSYDAYVAAWDYFTNIIEETPPELRCSVNNPAMGDIEIYDAPTCDSHAGLVYAHPRAGYRFVQWDNGVTTNPYFLNVDHDTSLVALFDNLPDGIASTPSEDYTLRTVHDKLIISGVLGRHIRVYDALGRILAADNVLADPYTVTLPVSGTYLVQIADAPLRRIVIVK